MARLLLPLDPNTTLLFDGQESISEVICFQGHFQVKGYFQGHF